MHRLLLTLTAALLTAPAWGAPGDDDAVLKLATGSGCMACHHIKPGAQGSNGVPALGPAWRDVAAKYKSIKGAQQQLTAIVMAGSSPFGNHWKDKASAVPMPPNKVAISEVEAARLVAWILALEPVDN